MRDYIVISEVVISFKSTIYLKATDYFDAEARVQKLIRDIISNNMDLLELIAKTLLEYETITKEQIDYLVEHGHMPVEDETEDIEETTEIEEETKEEE